MINQVPKRSTEQARLEIASLELNATRSLADIFEQIATIAAQTLEIQRVGIWLFVNNRTQLRAVELFDRAAQSHAHGQTLQVADYPKYFSALEVRKALPIELAATDDRVSELLTSYLNPLGISSLLDAPIFLRGEIVGVVCHEHVGQPREWTTEDRDFAGSVADLVSLKMKAAELAELQQFALREVSLTVERDKSQALTRMAMGVAHDFRNLLTLVVGIAELVGARRDVPSDVCQQMSDLQTAANQAQELTNQLMQYAKGRSASPIILDVREAIQRTVSLARSGFGARYPILLEAVPVGEAWMNPLDLERVVMNLLTNAKEAMPAGGAIHVRLWNEPTRWIVLEVADHGVGIDASIQSRIFEPYFSTKTNGTGLGLALVKQFVEQVGGEVELTSNPGAGTRIRMRLPAVSERRTATA